jgi:hypothetical protein
MVTPSDKINFILTDAEIYAQIQRTIDNPEIIGIDNLRPRDQNVKFDCLLRGYIGEIAILNWFRDNGINIDVTNHINDGDSIDIDFFYKEKNIELKTSLVPDRDRTVDRAIEVEDIKIIKRVDRIEDLRGDIHMQIYFNQMRSVKDNWLKQQNIDFRRRDLDYLFNAFHAADYRTITYFVAWIDKPSLVTSINALPNNINARTWSFPGSMRRFWKCKIRDSKKPKDLIPYLLNL